MSLPARMFFACALFSIMGCMSASHRVRRMDDRRAPRAEACSPDSLPVYTDHGPDERRLAFAVVTSECRESKEDECRTHLRQAGCEAQADALIDVTNQIVQGHRRMVGTAVEYLHDTAPTSGSAATP